MKFNKIIVMLLIVTLFVGCSNNNTELQEDSEKMKVYVSNYPLYDITSNIVGENSEVINIRKNSGVHGWEPSAKDIADLQESDVFIYSGPEIEGWAKGIIEENDDIEIIDVSKGLVLLESSHHHGDDHSHENHEHEDHEEHHDHQEHQEDHNHEEHHDHEDHNHEEHHDHEDHSHEGHSHGLYDPHIWLSIRNAEVISNNIAEGLSKKDPSNNELYHENYENYASKLKSLDEEYSEKLSNNKKDTIIVSHEAYGYMARDYNFEQVGIEGVLAEGEPSVAQIDNIIRLSKELNVNTIFYEETISPKVATLIADEAGAKLELLSPIETISPEQEANGEDYLSIMRLNLEGIYKALNE